MPSATPKLGIQKPLGTETVNLQNSFNQNWDLIDTNAAAQSQVDEPFYLKSAVYNGSTAIVCTLGKGQADFLGTLVTKTADWTYNISSPAINTTYYVYIKSDGTATHNTTGAAVTGAVCIWKVAVGAALTTITTTDMRGRLPGAAARMVADSLAGHNHDAVYAKLAGATFTGAIAGTSLTLSGQLTSNVANGTAPFVVTSGTVVTNLNADKLDGNDASAFATSGHNHDATYAKLAGATFTGGITGTTVSLSGQLSSTVATGTAPMVIASTTVVTNLNADKLDGNDASAFATAGHNHDAAYAALGHTHAGVYATATHNHDTAYLALGGGTLTGTLTTTNTSAMAVKASTYKSWVMHHPAANQLIFAPSATVDAIDWDWANQFVFKDTGDFAAKTLTSTVANGTAPFTVTSGTVVANLNADKLDGNDASAFAGASHNHDTTYAKLAGATFTGGISGTTASFSGAITSTVATGAAPFVVASTTVVTNLNADKLDGNDASAFATAGHNHTGTYADASHNHDATYAKLAGATFTGQIQSTVAAGTAPFVVASNTVVTNLNADLWDGQHIAGVGSNITLNNNMGLMGKETGGTARALAYVDASNIATFGDVSLAHKLVGTSLLFGTYKIWHEGNDGSGSTLDADLLDGNEASAFATAGHNHSGVYATAAHNHDTVYAALAGATFTGNINGTTASFSGLITSTRANGYPPFAVASTTMVTNLNSQFVGGSPINEIMHTVAGSLGTTSNWDPLASNSNMYFGGEGGFTGQGAPTGLAYPYGSALTFDNGTFQAQFAVTHMSDIHVRGGYLRGWAPWKRVAMTDMLPGFTGHEIAFADIHDTYNYYPISTAEGQAAWQVTWRSSWGAAGKTVSFCALVNILGASFDVVEVRLRSGSTSGPILATLSRTGTTAVTFLSATFSAPVDGTVLFVTAVETNGTGGGRVRGMRILIQ